MSAEWEVVLANGTVVREVTDIDAAQSGNLSLWIGGRRAFEGEFLEGVFHKPDLVLARGAWLAYRIVS